MSGGRGLANAAIVIGLIVSPIVVCVGLFQGAAVGLASSGGDCGGGCSQRHAEQSAAADRLIYGGLIGGAVLVFGTPADEMWDTAMRTLGIDPRDLFTGRGVN